MRIRTPHDLSALARGRRLDLGWTQLEVAHRARVSRKWVSDFETGKATVDLAAVMRLLDALDIALASVDPEAQGNVDLDAHLKEYLER